MMIEGELVWSVIKLTERLRVPRRALSVEQIFDLGIITLLEHVRVAPRNRSTTSRFMGNGQRNAFVECPGVESDLALVRTTAHGDARQINLGLREHLQGINNAADSPGPADHVARGGLRTEFHEIAGSPRASPEKTGSQLVGSISDRGNSAFAELVAGEAARWGPGVIESG